MDINGEKKRVYPKLTKIRGQENTKYMKIRLDQIPTGGQTDGLCTKWMVAKIIKTFLSDSRMTRERNIKMKIQHLEQYFIMQYIFV